MSNPTLERLLGANNPVTILTGSDLSALASGSAVVGAGTFSNVQGDANGGGFPEAYAYLHIDSMAVSANGIFDFFLLPAPDGTHFSQGSASVIPLTLPWYYQFVPVVQTAAIDLVIPIQVPICANFKCLARNNALGAALPANANAFLKLYFVTDQYPLV